MAAMAAAELPSAMHRNDAAVAEAAVPAVAVLVRLRP